MEDIIQQILSHPLLSFTLALLCVLLLFAILKGLIKLVIIALILAALYFAWGSKYEKYVSQEVLIALVYAFASSLVLAVVQIMISIPLITSTLS